jgi:hypothetical protein
LVIEDDGAASARVGHWTTKRRTDVWDCWNEGTHRARAGTLEIDSSPEKAQRSLQYSDVDDVSGNVA